MTRAGSGYSLFLVSIAALSLSACVMPGATGTTGGEQASTTQTAATGPASRVIERDVEAPEVFQVSDRGLWDGRPSLGGVWVAHPTATDPERVMIRNPTTGASVIGALFRRERDNPGPRFQISSEAADALGILAGAPTDIDVTALRLQRVELEIEPAPGTTTAAEETLALAPVIEPGAVAETATPQGEAEGQVAVAAVDPEPRRGFFSRLRQPAPAAPSIETTALAPIEGTAVAATATADATATGVAVVTPEPQQRSGFFGRLFRRDNAPVEPDTTAIAVPGIDTAGAPLAAPMAATAPASASAPAASRLDRPFVQIGIFSVESNASGARARMQQAGLTAEIRRGQAGANQFWRVVVGPAQDVAQRETFLRQVRSMGFTDAYAVVR